VDAQELEVLKNRNPGPFFNNLPESSANEISNENIVFLLSFPDVDFNQESVSFFISDAELQTLHIREKVFYAGKYQNTEKLSNSWDYRHFTIPSRFLIEEEIFFTGRNITKEPLTLAPSIVQANALDNGLVDIIAKSKTGIVFMIFFLGAIAIFLVYTIGLTMQTGNPDFKFYAYYLGAILLHNLIQADAFLKIFAFFPRNPIWYHHLNEFLQMFIYAFFALFIKVFLDVKKQKPILAKFIDRSIAAIIVFAFVFLGTALITKDFSFIQDYLSILWLVVAALGAIIVTGVTRKSANPVRYYILVGSFFLLVGSFLELYSSLSQVGGYNWNLYAIPKNQWYPFNYTQAAILLETVCFALGIGYKIRMTDLERQRNIDLEKRLLEKELSALRSQMNPHFLFNSLNSVNNYIMKEDPQS